MEQIISKEELDELMKLKGEARAGGIKNNAEFILKEEGEEGLKKLESMMAELGYPIKYREIKSFVFHDLGLDALTLVVIKRLFNYDDKKFQEMGRFQAKSSMITRVFMSYFLSIKRGIKGLELLPKIWRKYFTFGDPKIIEYDIDKGYVILRIENFCYHPLHCQILIGILSTIFQMITKREARCEEIKCLHRGDNYHEFLIKWQ